MHQVVSTRNPPLQALRCWLALRREGVSPRRGPRLQGLASPAQAQAQREQPVLRDAGQNYPMTK